MTRGPVAVAGEVVSPNDPTVEAFLGWLRVERGRASSTVQAYRRDILAHLAWLERSQLSVDGGAGPQPTRTDLERWVRSLLDEGRARSSVARAVASVRGRLGEPGGLGK